MTGTIKNYNSDKGFGFILGDDKYNYFFHISNIGWDTVARREEYVEFDRKLTKKAMRL